MVWRVFILKFYWDSIKSASISLAIASNNICECAKNKRKTAGGYKWEYERIN